MIAKPGPMVRRKEAMNVEDLHPGASVQSSDGHKLGSLSRVVLDKATFKLTHVVVDTGIFRSGEPLWKGGWGMTNDRVVPIGAVAHADSDNLRLTMSGDEFKEMTAHYTDEHFELMPNDKPGPDVSDLAPILASIPGGWGPYVLIAKHALAPGEVEIQRDSPVWRLNPHQKLGEVERVIYEHDSKKVTELIVRRGFLLKKDVRLPVACITDIFADIVRVEIDDAALAALPEYKPAD
jgi:uncharacterized protein YrrD